MKQLLMLLTMLLLAAMPALAEDDGLLAVVLFDACSQCKHHQRQRQL